VVAGSNPARSISSKLVKIIQYKDFALSNLTLGQIKIEIKEFKHLNHKLEKLNSPQFLKLNEFQKQEALSLLLLNLIQEEPSGFVLRQIADFIRCVHSLKLVSKYTIFVFENWLNQYSGLSEKENLTIRGKIVGKTVPRYEYQGLFPIGMGKTFDGPHFVTAHGSPDLDTIVASFWGWVDAFGARVSSGLHIWNVPSGPPKAVTELDPLFYQVFGDNVFSDFSRSKEVLNITAFDLLTKNGMTLCYPQQSLRELTDETKAVVLVDDEGNYVGDWKGVNSEKYRRILNLFYLLLHYFETQFQHTLIKALSSEKPKSNEIKDELKKIFNFSVLKTEVLRNLTVKEQTQLDSFLRDVLQISHGIESSMQMIVESIGKITKLSYPTLISLIEELFSKDLFDSEDRLLENRPLLLQTLEKSVSSLFILFREIRSYLESFYVALGAKEKVLGLMPDSVAYNADIEEVKSRMDRSPFLTVNLHLDAGVHFPLGVIFSQDIQRQILGTVTLRDFSNKEETKIPSYLEIISGLDHHKFNFSGSQPATITIKDVQSANVLVAFAAFEINDRYSFSGIKKDQIDHLIGKEKEETLSSLRLKQRLLMRKANMLKYGQCAIDEEREFLEYYHFLFAILDDTDLLSKVTHLDINCVASLLNRMKSLQLKKEVEEVHFDDLDVKDPSFSKKATLKLLQNKELYSLYQIVYEKREKDVEKHLESMLSKPTFPLFEDTKTQNGCARVGQKKLYSSNFKAYFGLRESLKELWLKESFNVLEKTPAIDLHMLMMTTIASTEDVFKGASAHYSHQDELWIAIPDTETAVTHLKLFLNQFKRNQAIQKDAAHIHVEVFGKTATLFKLIFEESFIQCPVEAKRGPDHFAVIYHSAGILNSRKTMISPFLPVSG